MSPRDFPTAGYDNVCANELLGPLQVGQGTRLDPSGTPKLVFGVTDSHLSDDLCFEYTRILRDSALLTAGVGTGKPGAGMRALGVVDTRTGGYANPVILF